METYFTEYELLIDLPSGEKKGQLYKYHVNEEGEMLFYPLIDGYKILFKANPFSLSEIQNKNFFKPSDKAEEYDLIQPFPELETFESCYYLIGENRLVASVDAVRLINPIFYSDEYYNKTLALLNRLYDQKYFPNTIKDDELWSDENIRKAFKGIPTEATSHANTIDENKEIVAQALLKSVCGYTSGQTVETILERLGFLKYGEITNRGQRALYLYYENK